MAAMWLSDAELTQVYREFVAVLQPRLANPPKRGRKRRVLGTVLLPGSDTNPALTK